MSKGKKGKKGRNKRGQTEDSYGLQAIILADSYDLKRFRPITHAIPKMLIPLAGCPMINYSIDLLINSNVNEIFIICSSHSQQLEDYINASQWKNPRWFPKLSIHIVRIDGCESVGAALRHMHTLNYIQSKIFILCRGDCVANISLKNIINKHKQRYKESTNTLMTCLFKKASHKQRATSLESDLFIVTNDDNELLQYENDKTKLKFSFDLSVFDEHDEIDINHNIIDCGIDICSKTVLSLFEDNFDYESIRKELFEGVIRSEIYAYKIYCAFLSNENEYASRISDWKTYAGITSDIMERWTYPLVLDSNTVSHNYLYQRNNIYKEDNIKIGLQTKIVKNCILGFSTLIGNNCFITKSIIGPNCNIGNNCCISNSYIFGKCNIGNNTKLNGVVIAENVIIGNNCNITKGCILSYNVVIDNNIQLSQYTKITSQKVDDDCDDDFDDNFGDDSDLESGQLPKQSKYKQSPKGRVRSLSATKNDAGNSSDNSLNEKKTTLMSIMNDGSNDESNDESNDNNHDQHNEIKYDKHIVGENGKGFLYETNINDVSYVINSINNVLANYNDKPIRGEFLYDMDDEDDNKQFPEDKILSHPTQNGNNGNNQRINDNDDSESGGNDGVGVGGDGVQNGLDLNKLVSEISACIDNAEENTDSINMENVVIEITTSIRLSNNAKLSDFTCAVFLAILSRISDDESVQTKKEKIEHYAERYSILFEKLSKKEDDQINIIIGFYNACNSRQNGLIYFFLEGTDKLFYEDIISLQSIEKWNETRSKNTDGKFEKLLQIYIQQWIEADQDDDDEDDDDDEEDSD